MENKKEERSPWADGFAEAARFAREAGLRRRAGFYTGGLELWSFGDSEPAYNGAVSGFRGGK